MMEKGAEETEGDERRLRDRVIGASWQVDREVSYAPFAEKDIVDFDLNILCI